jgi:hypothetical protein
MVVEIGPCPAAEADGWTKFARRMIIELKSDPGLVSQVSPDLIDLWSEYIDRWAAQAAAADAADEPFRWSESMEPEVGEFLLHGLDRYLHSPFIKQAATEAETEAHMAFTMKLVRAFVEGLSTEGKSFGQYVDQILISFGAELDD